MIKLPAWVDIAIRQILGRYSGMSIVIKSILVIFRVIEFLSCNIQIVTPIRIVVTLAAKGRIHKRLGIGKRVGWRGSTNSSGR